MSVPIGQVIVALLPEPASQPRKNGFYDHYRAVSELSPVVSCSLKAAFFFKQSAVSNQPEKRKLIAES
jgi:hypothetical protein